MARISTGDRLYGVTRRTFLRLGTVGGAFLMTISPLRLLAFAPRVTPLRDELGAASNADSATGYRFRLLNLAQVSDVHIVDDHDPLRFENLSICEKQNAGLGWLDGVIQSISRDQDPYTARIWDATIRSINAHHRQDPLDFTISTGDHTDTDTEKELSWFIEIADGLKSDSFRLAVEDGGIYDVDPEGLAMPWYAVLGNHDVEYQGTANNEILVSALVPLFGARSDDLCDQAEAVEKYKGSVTLPWWHGFENQPPQAYGRWQGYYSFSPNAYTHCIVLNTANYNLEGELPKQTLSLGCLDQAQYDWMVGEIEDHSDRLCLIFSHHSPVANPESGEETTSFKDSQSDITAGELRRTLCAYEHVVAHINGHSHINHIAPVTYDDLPGGYWNINTCAIIEWPQEWRHISLSDNGDGTGTLACRMYRHDDQECLDVAAGDADARPAYREGGAGDRDVDLLFALPLSVALTIRANPPEDPAVVPEEEQTSKTPLLLDGSDSRCFIATAAYGTPLAGEVATLRRFRDRCLMGHAPGRALVHAYYQLSPALAACIAPRALLRTLARGLLTPLVACLRRIGV